MTALDSDIARIAALRGRTPADYAKPRAYITTTELDGLLLMDGNTVADLAALEDLDASSRTLLTAWERPINARAWRSLEERYGAEMLIRIFRAWYMETTGREGLSPVRKPRRRWS